MTGEGMVIGYVRLGRSFQLNPDEWTGVGGDADAWRLLYRLAVSLPEAEIRIVGRNTGEAPADIHLPGNVTNPWHGTDLQKKARLVSNVKAAEEQQRVMFDTLAVQKELMQPLWEDLTHIVMWIGQHGTSNWPIPITGKNQNGNAAQADNGLTKPQVSFFNYCAYVIALVNDWVDVDPATRVNRVIGLNPDPRNYLKARDFKWPMPEILAQYDEERAAKFERHGDRTNPALAAFPFPDMEWSTTPPSAWEGTFKHVYSGLELTALPAPGKVSMFFGDDRDGAARVPFGMIVNENRPYVSNSRLQGLDQYVFPWTKDFPLRGKWTDKSIEALAERGVEAPVPVPYTKMFDLLRTFKSTLMLPASGSRWATAKPWECFAAGTVCFMHPLYDEQSHICAGRPKLQAFLRVSSAEELRAKVQRLQDEPELYVKVREQQRSLFEERFAAEGGGARAVLERIQSTTVPELEAVAMEMAGWAEG